MASEYGEDIWIKENVALPAKGYYLDLGCAWPEYNSNTTFLRAMGWDGVAVDANPIYSTDWHGKGKFVTCIIGDGNDAEFEFNPAPDLGRIGKGTPVKTRTIETIIESDHIDFISCDLEGHEFEALSRLNFTKYKPLVIVSEYDTAGKGRDFRVANLLVHMGYEIRHMTKANFVFVLQ